MKKKKQFTNAERLNSINYQIMNWKLRLSKGGYIRGRKNPDLCQFHLDRCLKKREQIQSELKE